MSMELDLAFALLGFILRKYSGKRSKMNVLGYLLKLCVQSFGIKANVTSSKRLFVSLSQRAALHPSTHHCIPLPNSVLLLIFHRLQLFIGLLTY